MSSRTSRTVENAHPSRNPEATRLPNALTPVIVSISRSALASSSSRSTVTLRCSGSCLCGGGSLTSSTCALVRPSFATRCAHPLLFLRARRELFARNHTRSGLCRKSRKVRRARSPFASRRSGRAARAAHVPNICSAGMRSSGDPGRHRPMSATHDSVFKRMVAKRWAPVVSVHSASRIPTRRSGSRYTPFSSQPR
jgi:hypothetical protein